MKKRFLIPLSVFAILVVGFASAAFFLREYRLESTYYSHAAIEPTLYVGPNSDNDGDIASVNAWGDTAYFWVEGATKYRENEYGTYVGHNTGGFLAVGSWGGLWTGSRVIIRGQQFELRPRMDMDSVMVFQVDSANGTADFRFFGELFVGPDEDGDGEIWFKNLAGDSAVVDMDQNGRYFAIQHAATGGGYGVLSGRNGWNGNWRVLGDFSARATVEGDSLLYIDVDSTNGFADLYLKGEMQIGPDSEGDGEIWFFNANGDSGVVDLDNNPRAMFIQHPNTGSRYGALSGRNGWNGDWRIVGDFSARATVEGDSLFSIDVDSTNGRCDVYIKGSLNVTEGIGGSHIQVYSTAGFSATLTLADTYYALVHANLDSTLSRDFSFDVTTGAVTYTGAEDKTVLFLGSANISSSNNANTTTFALYKDSAIVPYATTPTDFTTTDRLKTISINWLITVSNGDVFSVRAKCDVAATTLTVEAIQISFKGV